MKKTFLVFFVLALLLFMPSCEGKSAKTEVPTLIWWLMGTQPQDLFETVKTISDYTQEKIGVRFEIRMAGWGDSDRFQTVVNSGEYFDIMFTTNETYNVFTALGAFAEIEELVKTEAPGLLEVIPPLVWDGVRIKGKVYAVPTYKDSSTTLYHIWDEAYVKKYNLDITQTGLEGLDRNLRKIKDGEGRRFYPMPQSRGTTNFFFDGFDSLSAGFAPLGVRLDDTQKHVVNTLEDPYVIEAHRYLHQWYRDGIINADANIAAEAPKRKTFFIAQGWPAAARLWAALELVDNYQVERFMGPTYKSDSIQGSMNAVSANSKYKKEALKLLELANTDRKFRDMLAYGIEGKHFEYTGPETIRKLNEEWTMAAYQQATFFILSVPDDQAGAWGEVKALNEMAKASPLLGFVLDITNVRNEVAACRTVWDKYRFDMTAGASDPDVAFPACIAELKNNGFDKIIAEAQRQIDEQYGISR